MLYVQYMLYMYNMANSWNVLFILFIFHLGPMYIYTNTILTTFNHTKIKLSFKTMFVRVQYIEIFQTFS